MLAVIYVPFLQVAFRTVRLDLMDWVIIVLVASTVLIAVEIAKFIASLREKRHPRAQVGGLKAFLIFLPSQSAPHRLSTLEFWRLDPEQDW